MRQHRWEVGGIWFRLYSYEYQSSSQSLPLTLNSWEGTSPVLSVPSRH